MTQGLHRFHHTGNFHFITFSCFGRKPYLGQPDTRHLFESALERIRQRYAFVVIGYVVMPEHVHLLMNEPKNTTLDRAIQAIKLSVTKRTSIHPFWQARYYDFNVWNPEKITEKLRYMHRNPVTRGLVAQPEDWVWSSFRHYQSGVQAVVEIESFWTAAKRLNQLNSPGALRLAFETWG
jgi:putative transposase